MHATASALGARAPATHAWSATLIIRTVDVLAAIRSSRFDLPLTYDARDLTLRVGDVVRVPLRNRDVVGFVVSATRQRPQNDGEYKPVLERLDVPPAFDAIGLHLARFVAERYVCTLPEALGAIILGGAVPRMRDTLVRGATPPQLKSKSDTATRLLRLIWEDFAQPFELQRLLRHPAARRIGDRPALMRAVTQLVQRGELERKRHLVEARSSEYRIRTLLLGQAAIRGSRAQALVAMVMQRPDGVPRADAVLAGFSNAVIARALKVGALREIDVVPERQRSVPTAHDVPAPTADQSRALQRLASLMETGTFAQALLFGVTGSGKTYVYVEAIKRVVRDGGRAIVLVPEIALTPQTAARFEAAFGQRVAVLHSALSDRERFDAWQACRRGEIDVVVGARSAVFAPLCNVRLMVVDEAHESSYKQETVPRYRATAVARERMRLERGLLVLGSATPSLESYVAAQAETMAFLKLPTRATEFPMPLVRVVDLTNEFESGNRRIFSGPLVQALAERLKLGEKSVLFVNRRGSARFVLCRSCGHVPQCPRCSVALSAHRSESLLRCHYCDFQEQIPVRCPACGSDAVKEFGIGTEAVAEEVLRLFKEARVVRMDSDTTTRVGDHARLLREFETSGDVLVGTQMIAKGLDYPTVTLAAVVAADVGLHVADFRAAERSFALIAQVCGRSGRGRVGEAIVQTYAPTHPAIVFAALHDYEGFARQELEERRTAGYPPFRRLAYVGVIGASRRDTQAIAESYAVALRSADGLEVFGPAAYPVARRNGEWRFRIALRSRNAALLRATIRSHILPAAQKQRSTRIAVDIDP